MTSDLIKPFLIEADRRRPELAKINSAMSCFELLQLALALAGKDWAFVGKTRSMDGASVTPAGFIPLTMKLLDRDGIERLVEIIGVSQDAAWHLPTRRQVKVIANSSANDDADPLIHGNAKLDPYDIDPQFYRWHNPPVLQFGNVATPIPAPPPPAPAHIGQPYPDEPTFWRWYIGEVKKRYERAHRTFDATDLDSIVWSTRCAFMIGNGLVKEEAAAKYLQELEQALGL